MSDLSRAFAAEVRAEMGRRRMSVRQLAAEAGFQSHNYVAIRLRDERSFTLDDVAAISKALDRDPVEFALSKAQDRNA